MKTFFIIYGIIGLILGIIYSIIKVKKLKQTDLKCPGVIPETLGAILGTVLVCILMWPCVIYWAHKNHKLGN